MLSLVQYLIQIKLLLNSQCAGLKMKVERDCKTLRRKCMHDAESSFGGEVVLSVRPLFYFLTGHGRTRHNHHDSLLLFTNDFEQEKLLSKAVGSGAALRNEGVKRINWLLSSRTCIAFGINPSLCYWCVYLLMSLTTTSIL